MTSKCLTCDLMDNGCPLDPAGEVTECQVYQPTWPPHRGTTHGELMQMQASSESSNPDHYKTGGIECIDAMRDMLGYEGFIAYCRGNIMRYNWRLGKKDDPIIEMQKIDVYQRWIRDTMEGKPLSKGH